MKSKEEEEKEEEEDLRLSSFVTTEEETMEEEGETVRFGLRKTMGLRVVREEDLDLGVFDCVKIEEEGQG